ncbi:hypothetical protein [Caballeronia grimmiae]|uniref:hypothetical protein n=1 Tax=Caballeronia grimmiae TaxID=1071679 RepID=UPI0038BBCCB6
MDYQKLVLGKENRLSEPREQNSNPVGREMHVAGLVSFSPVFVLHKRRWAAVATHGRIHNRHGNSVRQLDYGHPGIGHGYDRQASRHDGRCALCD